MGNKNLLSGRDKELQELAEKYESAKAEARSIYIDAEDLADLADLYAMRGRYRQASEVTEYGLTLHPGNTSLLVEQAYLLIDTQHREEAKQIAEQITEDYSAEVKVLKANILMGDGKIDEAELLLDTIEDKDELANIVDIAYMYTDTGYPDKALEWLDTGVEKYSEKEAFLAATADSLQAIGKTLQAEKYYNKLIDKNPYSASYWFGLANCYFGQEKYDKAIEACDYAIVSDEEFSEAYVMKGHAFTQLGNEESALENYTLAEKYKALPPTFIHVYSGLSEMSKEHWTEAYSHLELAIQNKEAEPETLSTLYGYAALCLFKLGKKQKANEFFKTSHEIEKENVDSYLMEGRMLLEDGNLTEARKAWEIALEYSPGPETWDEIGVCCMELGALDYSREALKRTKELDPSFDYINEKLTLLYLLLKDTENFEIYNRLCKHPFQPKKAEEINNVLKSGNPKAVAEAVKNILNALIHNDK